MPLMTSKPYTGLKNNHNFVVSDKNLLATLKPIYVDQNIAFLESYLAKPTYPLNYPLKWEYAAAMSSSNINNGAPLTVIFNGQATLLHGFICQFNNYDIVKSLAAHHIDFNQNSYFYGSFNGEKPIDGTPLHILMSYYNVNLDSVKIMLDNGAALNILNSSGDTPLEVAKKIDNTAAINFIEDYIQSHDLANQKSITFEEYQAALDAKEAELKEKIAEFKRTTCPADAEDEVSDEDTSNAPLAETATSWSGWALSHLLKTYAWLSSKTAENIPLADVIKTNNDIDFGNSTVSETVADNHTVTQQPPLAVLPQNETVVAQEWT